MENIIFTSHKIKNLDLKNRVIMTAMHLGYSFEKEQNFYIQRAKGGVAAITTVMGVAPVGAYDNMLCADNETGDKLNSLSNALHEYDTKLIVQLFCAGRNGKKGIMYDHELEPIAPSPVESKIYKYPPREMTKDDIDYIIETFGYSAKLCKENGVDAVEISCSAGYLLSQFLSPLTNLRNDEYGGTNENRMKFPIEVLKKVREKVGNNFPIILRISGSDMLGGYDIDYMKNFIKAIPDGLFDAVNVTGGWHESSIPQIDVHLPKGGWAILASQIKSVTRVPVIACNRINDRETAEAILTKGMADFVGCARAHLADAEFVNKIKNNIPYTKCVGCNKGCIEPILKMKEVQCVMNPITELNQTKNDIKPRNILVIGAGPAGLTCGKYLAMIGHKVSICTDNHQAGGLVNLACIPPGKQDVYALIESLIYDLGTMNIHVKTNTRVDKNYLVANKFDQVVVATGSTPIDIGLGKENVYTADEILTGDHLLLSKVLKGSIAIIGGGLVGVETAKHLIDKTYVTDKIFDVIRLYDKDNKCGSFYSYPKISILEMKDSIGKEFGSTRFLEMKELKEKQVNLLANAKVTRYEGGRIYYDSEEGSKCVEADSVIMALGYRSNGKIIEEVLHDLNIPYVTVGDAWKVANIKEAIISAYNAVYTLKKM
ncbi:MAG: FAD-dependent oxidoreductase [Anaerovoracaceae bacterium]